MLAEIAVDALIVDRNPYLDDPLMAFGRSWVKKESQCRAGPGGNYFLPENVWVDDDGLHLAITNEGDRWWCSELYLAESLGYGEYRVHSRGRIDLIDARMVIGWFTWDNFNPPDFSEIESSTVRTDVEHGDRRRSGQRLR